MGDTMLATARTAAEEAMVTARERAHGARERVAEMSERVLPHEDPPKRGMPWRWVVLFLVGAVLTTAVVVARRRQESTERASYDAAPDAFGDALDAQRSGGQPVATPGA